jgi:hypothetical protein
MWIEEERGYDAAKDRPDFARGEDRPEEFHEDERVGSFAEGEEEEPDVAERERQGRFSEGEEELSEADPEKHVEGSFGDVEEEEED